MVDSLAAVPAHVLISFNNGGCSDSPSTGVLEMWCEYMKLGWCVKVTCISNSYNTTIYYNHNPSLLHHACGPKTWIHGSEDVSPCTTAIPKLFGTLCAMC